MVFFFFMPRPFENVWFNSGGYILGCVQPPKGSILMLHRTVFILHCVVVAGRKRSCGKVMFLFTAVCQPFCSRGRVVVACMAAGPCVVGACMQERRPLKRVLRILLESILVFVHRHRVPTQTGKPGKMERHFPVREKSGNLNRLEKSGKIMQNTGKQRNSEKFKLLFLVLSK